MEEALISRRGFWAACALTLVLQACGGGSDGAAGEADAAVSPTIGTAQLQPNAKVVDAAVAGRMTLSLNEGRIEMSTVDAAGIGVGDTLVIDRAEVPLLKVVSVSTAGSRTVLAVEETSLVSVFKELHIQMSGDLGRSDFTAAGTLDSGELSAQWTTNSGQGQSVRAQAAASGSGDTLSLQYKSFGASTKRDVEVTGDASFRVNPSLNIDLVPGAPGARPSLEMVAKVAPELQASVQVRSAYGGAISLSKSEEIKLGSVRRIVMAGPVPVPVWLTFNTAVSAQVEGSFASAFTTTRTYRSAGELGFSRTQASGLQPISSYSASSTLDVADVGGAGVVTVTPLKIELMAYLYNAAGPTFDIGASGEVKGQLDVQGTPSVEGVAVTGTVAIKANANLKARAPFNDVAWIPPLLRDVGIEYTAFSLELYKTEEEIFHKFFPFSGVAAVVVRDNGSAADDIFEVALDGVVMGRTSKGGSGQFRLKNLRPGQHTLRLTTVEDDSPPGTWEITLNEGLTFSDGTSRKSGNLSLGASTSFVVVVP